MAGSHVRKSRKAGTWLAAMCGLPAFLLYAHTQNLGTRIRGTPVPGLGAATLGRVILTLRAPPVHASCDAADVRARMRAHGVRTRRTFIPCNTGEARYEG